MHKVKKGILFFLALGFILLLSVVIGYELIQIDEPKPSDLTSLDLKRVEIGQDHYSIGNNWFRKSVGGVWEMYLEGGAFERGVIRGKLSKELLGRQEQYFVDEILRQVPSPNYLKFLKYFISWFNRNLDEHIDEEYLLEIYGVSLFQPDRFDFIAPKFARLLNYHAAHDIGHALVNMNMVGCTSFSVWDERSVDSSLLVARNFDFYFGDDFSKEKIVCFVNPDQGYPFAMISWAGMIGAVSGMNDKGLTVTINAAPSDIPVEAATPITIVVRKILQYASNITEAYEIAQRYTTFVSETIMIGSAEENETALIEISPKETALVRSDENWIVCSNHFQSEELMDGAKNQESINTSDSPYRFQRMKQLIDETGEVDYKSAADILRNKEGVDDQILGFGNQKAINQLIAHHAVIFKPQDKLMWVSTYPYQLGEFLAYDLSEVFKNSMNKFVNDVSIDSLEIAEDPFLTSEEFDNFLEYKELRKKVETATKNGHDINHETLQGIVMNNPFYYSSYEVVGDYYYGNSQCDSAVKYYEWALTLEVATTIEANSIREKIKTCK